MLFFHLINFCFACPQSNTFINIFVIIKMMNFVTDEIVTEKVIIIENKDKNELPNEDFASL